MQKNPVFLTERDRDAIRKKQKRNEASRIWIPPCVNPQRRERALADPELFLKTYFQDRYPRPFERVHLEMITALVEVATYGGKQAVAAPRGIGKSEIAKGMIAYLIFANLIRFPVLVCATAGHAEENYEDFRDKVANCDLLYEDFPEVCEPVRAINGAPQGASRQHIDDQLTRLIWKQKGLRLADIPAAYRGPIDYGGVRMEFYGLDAAIRGINRKGARPDFVPIDDPETRESAKSESQVRDRKKAVDQDIAGLAGHGKKLSQVMITTIQNRYCLSWQYVHEKPAWMGKCFGWVDSWPDEWNKDGEEGEGLWYEYIAKRTQDQQNGDRHGLSATQFYLGNRDAMEAGGKLNSYYFEEQRLPSGELIEHSAWQVIFNFISDTSYEAFCTEYQNQPPEQEQIETLELTAGKVISSTSHLGQGDVPDGIVCTTMGIDIGKYASVFTKIAWDSNATGWVVDYGEFRTSGLDKHSAERAVESAIIDALERFAESQEAADSPPLLTLVDAGNWENAVVEACRRVGENYYPSKGWDSARHQMPKPSDTKQPFLQAYASQLFDDHQREFWLYQVNTEYWKNWTQERWTQPVWLSEETRMPGSFALFEPPQGDIRFHTKFGKSQVSERLEHVPLPNKGFKAVWVVKDRYNNHFLDATALASAAGGCVGIRLVQPERPEPTPMPKKRQEPKPNITGPNGKPFLITQR